MNGIVILVTIGALIAIQFISNLSKVKKEIKKQVAMRERYKILVRYLLTLDYENRIVKETDSTLLIAAPTTSKSKYINLEQRVGAVRVSYKIDCNTTGEQTYEWLFDLDTPQHTMVEKITADIEANNSKIET